MHRDIKSMNILFEGDIQKVDEMLFVLTDFGESKRLCEKKTNTIKGTPSWMAPEVISGDSDYSYPADIWSFGMVLYELMTLKLPYNEEKFVVLAITKGKLPVLNDATIRKYAPLLPLYESCTDIVPNNRPNVERALLSVSNLKNIKWHI